MARETHREKHQTFNVESISNVRPINNRVLCKRLTHNIEDPIKGIYYPPQSNRNQRISQNVDVMYEVVVPPSKILKHVNQRWETEVEIKKGDIVWTTNISALNSPDILDEEGGEYRLLPYAGLTVARRGEATIPLNGNLLLSNMYQQVSGVDKNIKPIVHQYIIWQLAYVEYVGKSNKSYWSQGDLDSGKDIRKGMVVVLNLPNKNLSSMNRNYLEEEIYARFSEDKRYFSEKRRAVMAYIENAESGD